MYARKFSASSEFLQTDTVVMFTLSSLGLINVYVYLQGMTKVSAAYITFAFPFLSFIVTNKQR